MDFRWPDEYLAFRDEIDAFVHEWRTPELLEEMSTREGAPGPLGRKYYAALQEKGWMRMCWPKEMGGEGDKIDPTRQAGIHAIEMYVPRNAVKASVLEKAHGVDGKYTQGLMMHEFCGTG